MEGGQWARPTTLEALALKPGQRFYCQYDFGDNWQFHGRLHQIPARVGPALWAHARLTDTPAAQYAAWGKAPEQYPHAEAVVSELSVSALVCTDVRTPLHSRPDTRAGLGFRA